MSTTLPPGEPLVGEEPAGEPSARGAVAAPTERTNHAGPTEIEAWVPPRQRLARLLQRLGGVPVEGWITFFVLAACTAVVVAAAHPALILQNTTPTGGDMGSHVYGPKYLMDHLLPSGRLTGWTPAWFDGFPLFQFYMVLPALGVAVLATGFHSLLGGLVAALIGFGVMAGGLLRPKLFAYRWWLFAAGAAIVVLSVPVPYNISFKMITVVGLVSFPAAAWIFGKLADLPFPTPPLLAVAGLLYVFNRQPAYNGTGNIVGGNFASTMAGEYSFSIALALGVVYLGVVMRGMRTGEHRVLAAVLLAATGLCHLLPCFFVILVTIVIFLVQPAKARLKWFGAMLPLGGLLSAFWVMPFVLKRSFTNDMGWEKLPILPPDVVARYGQWFTHQTSNGAEYYGRWYYLSPPALRWVVVLAVAGLIISVVQLRRAGWVLAISAVILGALFVVLPNTQLWNARLLPFLYLCFYFLAAMAVGEIAYCAAVTIADLVQRRAEPFRPLNWVTTPVLGVAGIVAVLVPLGMMPGFSSQPVNPVSAWAKGNFSGLEHKAANPTLAANVVTTCQPIPGVQDCAGGTKEYFALIDTMRRLGQDTQGGNGCGRAMWEYDGDREGSYGTPMALMMLPYFTNECIGSMEGLYFESSATTPFHFVNQGELSARCSCTQRDMPYLGLNMALGIKHMQMLGVKYYMADTATTISLANAQPDLVPVAASGPWRIYRIRNSSLVTPLANKPAVMKNVTDAQLSWLPASMQWYLDPNLWDVPLAVDGPSDWPRITVKKLMPKPSQPGTPDPKITEHAQLPDIPKRAVTPAKVSHIVHGRDGISFDVDRTGSPVLVKVSYFPNWKASGAKGVYRVSPNLMVVVPTAKHVSLTYGRTGGDWVALLLTMIGISLAVWLARNAPVTMPKPRWSAAVGGAGDGPSVVPQAQDEERSERSQDESPRPRSPAPSAPAAFVQDGPHAFQPPGGGAAGASGDEGGPAGSTPSGWADRQPADPREQWLPPAGDGHQERPDPHHPGATPAGPDPT